MHVCRVFMRSHEMRSMDVAPDTRTFRDACAEGQNNHEPDDAMGHPRKDLGGRALGVRACVHVEDSCVFLRC